LYHRFEISTDSLATGVLISLV